MARFQVRGAVLGVRKSPYDFVDEKGVRQTGESVTVVLFDEASVASHELKVKRASAGKFTELGLGQPVEVEVDVFANLSAKGEALLTVTAVDVRDAA